MYTLNYIHLPDPNATRMDEGTHVTLFLDKKIENIVEENPENPEELINKEITVAIYLRVEKPLTRSRAINAFEMQAYRLNNALEVASFGISLARKSRINPEDPEVKEHDELIEWAKEKLTEIGI